MAMLGVGCNLVSVLFLICVLMAIGFLFVHANHEVPKGFISIDCGAEEDSVDPRSGFQYKSDKNLINSGVIRQISPKTGEEYYQMQYKNLRSFPEGVKNCYTLRPVAGRDNNYLIRAIFVYGNYDGKNSNPVFQIYLGVNLWNTIKYNATRIEAVYMAPMDNIEVCLVNIGTGVPYISTLELRQLDNSIYRPDDQQFMVLWDRRDVGGSVTLRYPHDVDDRIWISYDTDFKYLMLLKKMQTNESMAQNTNSKDPYKLPELMLKTAYGTLNSSSPFVYEWIPQEDTSRFYFCFYFAEIEKYLDFVREMSIVLNGIHTIAQSVKLQYLQPQTICSTSAGLPVNLNRTNYIQISAASGSDLPPIINGFEVFYLRDLFVSPTFLQDVDAIRDMEKTLKILNSDWQGDPCLPEISVWNGLNCSSSNPPRIISLNLSRSKLTGEIPFSISNLTQLETLDLSYNDLNGSLPEFLGQLPHLKILNLAGNNFGGIVPEALVAKSRDGVLDLSVADNPELSLSPPSNRKRVSIIIPVITSVIAAVVLVICLLLLLIYKRNKKK